MSDSRDGTSLTTNNESVGEGDTADVWSRQEIESPCVKICMIHPDAKICIGCYRTGAEIAAWSRMTPEERQDVMQGLASRAGSLTRRGGGRKGRIARRPN